MKNNLETNLLHISKLAVEKTKENDAFVKSILDEWPEAYAKYKPRQAISYGGTYITDEQVKRLLDYTRASKDKEKDAFTESILDDGFKG
jgi:hypothetical protein